MGLSRREFAEQLALMAAAPFLLEDFKTASVSHQPQQPAEPSALAKALAEGIRLRYPDRFTPEDLTTITRGIDGRLRAVERLYQTPLTNGDEPDFVYAVYRGDD